MIQEIFSRTNIVLFAFVCFSLFAMIFSFEKVVLQRAHALSVIEQIIAIAETMDSINNSSVEYNTSISGSITVSGNTIALYSGGFSVSRNSSSFSDAEFEFNQKIFFDKFEKVVAHG